MVMKSKSISTAHRVKEIIENFEADHIFATQDLLKLVDFGSRNSIDLILSRLVNKKVIVRLARGLFIKKEADKDKITPYKVALVKAKAFGKSIQMFGAKAAQKIGLDSVNWERSVTVKSVAVKAVTYESVADEEATNESITREEIAHKESNDEAVYIFYTSGSSSSFKFGKNRIQFVSASHKKRMLPDDISGMVIKAVWHFGHASIMRTKGRARYLAFNQEKEKVDAFRKYIRRAPRWIAKSLYRAVA